MLNDLIVLDEVNEDYLQSIKDFITEWENELDYIEATSSVSTGDPKKFQLKKDKVRRPAIATGQFFDFSKGQSILLNLSPEYIAGKLVIVRAI